MSLLGKLMSNARKADIGFGIHTNCVVLSASNEKRKNKDGEVVKRNCYTTIGQLDKDGNTVGEKTISYFNLDNTSEYVYDNFFTQLDQLTSIIDVYYPTDKKDIWGDAFLAILEEEEVEVGENAAECEANLRAAMADKETCNNIITAIGDVYAELIGKVAGKDSQPIRFKVVYDKSGKYLQQPKFEAFVESMEVSDEDSKLRISSTEAQYRAKSLSTSSTPASKPGKL